MRRWSRVMALGMVIAASCGCQALDGVSAEEPAPLPQREPTPGQVARLEAAEQDAEAGNYDRALSSFQALLAENPTITRAYLGIGDIHMDRREYVRAEPAFARAARLEPRNFDAQFGHGRALQMLERFVEAVRAFHRALTIEPEHVEANLSLATTYLQLEDPRRAVTFARRAVENGPENGPAWANLGAIYEELGEFGEAVDAYLAALELMGNKPPLMMNLINALAKENRFREAANTAQALIRIEPAAPAWERLGWCRFKLRDYEGSLEAYREAVDLDPDYWPALNGIGVNALNAWLLSKKRDADARAEARDAFRRSLRVNANQDRVVALMINYDLQ